MVSYISLGWVGGHWILHVGNAMILLLHPVPINVTTVGYASGVAAACAAFPYCLLFNLTLCPENL